MFKKVAATVALSSALLFGGTFSASADTVSKETSPYQIYKVYYSINGNWQSFSENNINQLLQKYMSNMQRYGKKIDWNNVHIEKQEANKENADQAADKQDKKEANQSAPEQPKQVEQKPKEQTPAEQPTEKPEQQKPVQQEKPSNQQVQEKEKQEPSQTDKSELSQFEQEVVDLTNQERAKQGLPALKVDTELSKVARAKSKDMAANGYFAHNSPTYGSPFDMMKQFGISYSTAGENIAKGQRSPQEVVNAWMNSQGHRENIMNAKFTHIGVGYVEQGNHWTQQFIGK
ncbi:CAP domain-containing protein [Virgibacillus dokdonensis]|uniref:CAP domain-containing protein n=1 Tax=Virgibacillus dokdonensis TaxID=302167 RepID=A0A2K9J128_9BACI|nr:CAP domain-containing protein [Virgibacillus dokdonensis]AUJ25414.1 Cysteine-rich secretory protein family protein [Virgibacillus dokdonensis]